MSVAYYAFMLSRPKIGKHSKLENHKKTLLWIRIHLDPHTFGCTGSGSVLGIRCLKIGQNLQIQGFSAFQKGFGTFVGMLFDILLTLSIFFMQKFNFLWLKSLIRIHIQIRICLDPHWFGFLDPVPYADPNWDKNWIRIRNETKADPQHWKQVLQIFLCTTAYCP